MAQAIDNDKDFLVIETSMSECMMWGGMAICDSCNESSHIGYYVAVLNHWMCPKCYNEWLQRAKRYEEDIPTEIRNYNTYANILGLQQYK